MMSKKRLGVCACEQTAERFAEVVKRVEGRHEGGKMVLQHYGRRGQFELEETV